MEAEWLLFSVVKVTKSRKVDALVNTEYKKSKDADEPKFDKFDVNAFTIVLDLFSIF